MEDLQLYDDFDEKENASSIFDPAGPGAVDVGNEGKGGGGGGGDSLEAYYAGDDNWQKVVFEFAVHGVLGNLVGVVGLVGNALCVFVLTRPQMRSSTSLILAALASFDMGVILAYWLMLGFPAVYRFSQDPVTTFYYKDVFPYATPFVYALGLISQTGSVYSTLSVTVERFVVVCHPLRAGDFVTYGRTRCAVAAVAAFALLYNVSRFFEVTWEDKVVVVDEHTNVTRQDIVTTPMRRDPVYVSVYITWLYLVFMYAVPFTGLSALNLLMFLDVRRSNSRHVSLSSSQKKEVKLAVMLMVVVLVFLICNALPFIVNIMELFDFSYKPLTEISNLLVTVNSSCNIFIYTIFGDRFQRQLCKYMKRCALCRVVLRACCCYRCCAHLKSDEHEEFYHNTKTIFATAAAAPVAASGSRNNSTNTTGGGARSKKLLLKKWGSKSGRSATSTSLNGGGGNRVAMRQLNEEGGTAVTLVLRAGSEAEQETALGADKTPTSECHSRT